LGEFLLEGPPIQGNFDHDLLWIPYTHAVKELLLDPGSRDWLDEDLETFLDRVELMGSVELDEAFRVAVEHRYTERNDRNNYNEQQDDEEAQIEEDPDEQERNDNDDPDNPRQSTNPWHHIRPFIFDKLLPPLGTAVCIFHITAMLGYVQLMNDPAPPNPAFIAGYVPSSSSPLTTRLTLHENTAHVVPDSRDDDWLWDCPCRQCEGVSPSFEPLKR
jgi:hypothetical protein